METAELGTRDEFEAEAMPHLVALWRTARLLNRRLSVAEDLVARTMIRAYRTWHDGVEAGDIRLWLFRILVREYNGTRGRWESDGEFSLRPADFVTTAGGGKLPDPPALPASRKKLTPDGITVGSVRHAISRFDPRSRLIVALLLRERFSYADIAYICDLRRESVKSILVGLRNDIPLYLLQYRDQSGMEVGPWPGSSPSES
ncbi:MAG: hypothetical protein KKA42_16790 [candidate division Zixibacteria bacterium]|nr:hypothetical protein [candidate division Zixibacteria bacterium]